MQRAQTVYPLDDPDQQAIVTTGASAYRRDDGIAVVPAALLGP